MLGEIPGVHWDVSRQANDNVVIWMEWGNMFLFSVINPLVFYVECRIRRGCKIVQFYSIPLLEIGVLDLDIFRLSLSMSGGQGNCTFYVGDWVSQNLKLRGDMS